MCLQELDWMAGMSGIDFNAKPLLIFLIERLIWFFYHYLQLCSYPLWCLQKTLFIGQEEEFFLGFIFLVENHFELQLIVNFQMYPVGLRLDHVVLLKCNDRLRRLYENKLIYVPRQYFCGFVDFLMTDVYIFFFSLYMYFCRWNFFGFWARRHFHRFYRNLFSFMRMDCMSSLHFNAD